jgi:hypothetical protein
LRERREVGDMVSEFLSGRTGTYPLSLTQWAYQSSTHQFIEEVNDQFSRRISDVASTALIQEAFDVIVILNALRAGKIRF